MSGKKQLGKISGVFFGIEDHGILTFYVNFDFGGSGQAFGGYSLDTYDKVKDRRIGSAAGTDLILRLLELFNVNRLEDIKGRTAYVLRDSDQWNGAIQGIEIPPFDGGGIFKIIDWQKEWFPDQYKEDKE